MAADIEAVLGYTGADDCLVAGRSGGGPHALAAGARLLAFAAPWGFELAEIAVPTFVWQGSADLMVPFAHGEWLAANVPGVTAHLEHGEGHLSIGVGALDRMLDELVTTR